MKSLDCFEIFQLEQEFQKKYQQAKDVSILTITVTFNKLNLTSTYNV